MGGPEELYKPLQQPTVLRRLTQHDHLCGCRAGGNPHWRTGHRDALVSTAPLQWVHAHHGICPAHAARRCRGDSVALHVRSPIRPESLALLTSRSGFSTMDDYFHLVDLGDHYRLRVAAARFRGNHLLLGDTGAT